MHEHFDADGNPCIAAYAAYTVVTREPEWDEESRGRALRLAEWERSLCPCGCGHPVDVVHDESTVVGVASYVCMAQRAVEVKRRKDEAEHKNDKPKADGARWNDGRNYVPIPQER